MQLIAVSDSYLINPSILSRYFSANELENLSKNVPKEQLNDRFLGRIALKHSITDVNFRQIIINYINFGEPILVNTPNIFCSIAHSHGLGVAITAHFKIGVDVETIRNHDESLLQYVASKKEISLFDEENQDILVTKIWVIKEAISKALGVGIAYPFKDMVIEKNNSDYLVIVGGLKWFAKVFQHGVYIIGYCYLDSETKKRLINVKYLQ